jgi:hypothetical protein
MSTISHEPTGMAQERRPLLSQLVVREMWASLAITMIWLSVLFDAIFGPNIYNSTVGGASSSVPSAVVLGLFAFLATWVVARYGLRERRE